MAISESDVDVFMASIATLFKPWSPSPITHKILRSDPSGQDEYWEVAVQVPSTPLPLTTGVVGHRLALNGPPTMISTNPKPGWSPIPDDLTPEAFEAYVGLPAGCDPTLVNTAVIGIPPVIKVEIPLARNPPARGGRGVSW